MNKLKEGNKMNNLNLIDDKLSLHDLLTQIAKLNQSYCANGTELTFRFWGFMSGIKIEKNGAMLEVDLNNKGDIKGFQIRGENQNISTQDTVSLEEAYDKILGRLEDKS